jgi:quercetin dioxygenase-like cupin family protein
VIVRGADLDFRSLPERDSADPFRGLSLVELSMRIVDVEPGERNPHKHPHSPEAMYVVSGSGVFWEDGTTERVTAGDCILVPPNTPHATLADEGVALRLACFFPRGDLATNIEELEGTIVLKEGQTS